MADELTGSAEGTVADHMFLANKLSAARTRLILDKPFIGALVLRLPLKAANPAWCPTTGTDARAFYYNPAYIRELRNDEIQFVMAHEALHCALSHFARRQGRVKHRWDLACDFAINPLLVEEGLKPPPGLVMMPQYVGMTAEEIYVLLDDNEHAETMDQHLYDKQDNPAEGGQNQDSNPLDTQPEPQKPSEPGQQQSDHGDGNNSETSDQPAFDESAGSGNTQPPPPLSHDESEMLSLQWQQRLASAGQQAEISGKLSGVMKRLIELQRAAALPWPMMLARYLSNTARDDYSYHRPSSRRGDPAILPTLRSSETDVVVAVDVSGSIQDKELNRYLSEINALKGQLRARITLLACDAEIISGFPLIFEAWETIEFCNEISGGGNTDFRPVFDFVEQQDSQPDVLLYFTDTQGNFPEYIPTYPVLWLVKGKGQVPWGERIQYQ